MPARPPDPDPTAANPQQAARAGVRGTAWAIASLIAMCSGAPAAAQSLTDLFLAAQKHDASYQAAVLNAQASEAHGAQAKAGVLPAVALTAQTSGVNQTSSYPAYDQRNFSYTAGAITATQPLYRPASQAAYAQGQSEIAAAAALTRSAEQELMVRLAQAYFDVLAASDTLHYLQAQKAAIASQLAAARRNFEIGTGTVVDTRDAQARLDLVAAQTLAADNDLRVRSLALDQLTGLQGSVPHVLRDGPGTAITPLQDMPPGSMDDWVRQSQHNNPALKPLESALDIARQETAKAQAGERPTLDLVASYTAASNNGSALMPLSYTLNQASIGLSLNLPLYSGGAIRHRVEETLAREAKAQQDLEAAQRNTMQATRAAFLGLETALAQVKAYGSALVSSQSALDANTTGYAVGIKTNTDVLNAQSQLYSTRSALAQARYNALMQQLRLRLAAGTLQFTDLQSVSALLAP